MSVTSITWIGITVGGYFLCFAKRPLYGVFVYMFVYYIPPIDIIYWWAKPIPNLRWSLTSAAVLLMAYLIHGANGNVFTKGKLALVKWMSAYFVLSLIVSVAFAVNSDLSFQKCYDFFRYIVIVYLIIQCLKDEKDLKLYIILILLCGLFLGYSAKNVTRHGDRLEGVGTPDAYDANGFALLMATIVPLGFPAFMAGNKYWKLAISVCEVFIINAIVLCNSRGAVISLFVSSIAILMLTRNRKLRRNIAVLGMVGIAGFAYLADEQFWDRFETISQSSTEDKGSGRLLIWGYGLEMLKEHPLGAGGDGFLILSRTYIPPNLHTQGGVRASHNTYLLSAVEQGYIGLFIYICWNAHIMILLRKARKTLLLKGAVDSIIKNKNETFLYMSNIAVTACLLGHLAGAAFGDRIYYEHYYFLLALAASIYAITIEKEKYSPKQRLSERAVS